MPGSRTLPGIKNGDEGIRTLDLSDANRTLSQLSYAPKGVGLEPTSELYYNSAVWSRLFHWRNKKLYAGRGGSRILCFARLKGLDFVHF